MEMKFFRAGRGEGKTQWLLERAIDARNAGYDVWYVGNLKTMDSLSDMWRAQMREICPIKHIGQWNCSSSGGAYCFVTDNVIDNIETVGFWRSVLNTRDGVWYLTIDKELFVDGGK